MSQYENSVYVCVRKPECIYGHEEQTTRNRSCLSDERGDYGIGCVTWSVVFFLDCCNRKPRTPWLINNRSIFIIALKVEKSETHVLGTHSDERLWHILGLPGV